MNLTAEEKEEVRETYLKILEILASVDNNTRKHVIFKLITDIFKYETQERNDEKNAD